ncbi:MAG: OmpA family protein [Cyclobacteriaceae bacterium]|nr:OmpA family protein [Cyclobacteriaceae bacterium]
MYYVYVLYTKDDLEGARAKRGSLRATRQFFDAWILYVGVKPEDFEKSPVAELEETPDVRVINQPKELKSAEMKAGAAMDMVPPPPVQQDQNTYNYRFNVIGATTLKEVPGYVTIIDATRNKAMKSVSTNQIHPLEAPATQSKEIIALCDIFGYVKEQAKFKIDDPMSSEDKGMLTETGGVTTVKFQLQRHKVGEILTMYNVYFYNDAAIMKPESKFELNSLLAMLKENEKLTVRIHGHTNGNDPGKLIKLKPDDNNYFEVTSNNIQSTSSAKDLSKERADVIRRWLLDQGIDDKRMEVKAWGGQKMIYKKTDSMAGKNVRVEIEILKE